MATLVPTTRTIVTLEDLAAPFVCAVWNATGELPEDVDLAYLYGKIVAECGHPGPGQCLWCGNVGNIRGVSKLGKYCVLRGAWELAPAGQLAALLAAGYVHLDPPPPGATVTPGTVCVLPPPEKQGFRAYMRDDGTVDLFASLEEYVDVLGTNFPHARAVLDAKGTTARGLVEAMKLDHYFTGDISRYVINVTDAGNRVLPRCADLIAGVTLPERPRDGGLVLGGDTAANPTGWADRRDPDPMG